MNLSETLASWRRVPAIKWMSGLFLIALSFALFSHSLRYGVFQTYSVGAHKILEHADPYPHTPEEFQTGYKYSPLFGVMFYPFSPLPLRLGSYLWRFLNLAIFLGGLTVFLATAFRGESALGRLLQKPWQTLVLILLTATPLIISLKAAQANPMVCGMILFALARYLDGREEWAGAVLALASNIKIFPLTFGLLLLLDFRRRYWMAFIGASLATLILPALALGWDWNVEVHRLWLVSLTSDFGSEDKLSLLKFLQHNFHFDSPDGYRAFTVVNILGLCVLYRFGGSALTAEGARCIAPLGVLFVLLFNHRTETELFVLVNPVYVLLFLSILERVERGERPVAEIAVLVAGHFCITLAHSDLVPDAVTEWLDQFKIRVFGALLFYGYYISATFSRRAI